jgi:hypothetical protein
MEHTQQELESMLSALSNCILRLEADYNSSPQQERVHILWEIQQLSILEREYTSFGRFNN